MRTTICANKWTGVKIALLALGSYSLVAGCSDDQPKGAPAKRVIVLGFDGMDSRLARQMLDDGLLPHFAKLEKQGGFSPLGTSTPPQSPVAWSSLITGTDPGKHGIFDFIHRDPKTYIPYSSTTETSSGGGGLLSNIKFGRWSIPLYGGGEVKNLRNGTPFWDYLTKAGINAHVYRMPANYPPLPSEGEGEFLTLTDMGTPDLRGSQGEFAFYTTGSFSRSNVSGGKVYRPIARSDVISDYFYGPDDPLISPEYMANNRSARDDAELKVEFTAFRDPDRPSVVIEWQDERILLQEGEWSDWLPITFDLGPSVAGAHMTSLAGSVRMYLKQVRPAFQLYVSPIQIDPLNPSMPIAYPDDFAVEVASSVGRYYSQGLPEDTKALTHDVLTRAEFLQQAEMVFSERLKLLDFAMNRFHDGFLFFYFGSTDQVAHMFWGAMSPNHPAISDDDRKQYHDEVKKTYIKADQALGKVMERFPDATLICVSDHGFLDFAKGFNLNTWLVENGYATLKDEASGRDVMSFDWDKTRAYALGINGLYINQVGREKNGIVIPANKDALMDEIVQKLIAYRDPATGDQPIKIVYKSKEVYSSDHLDIAPDMQVGYNIDYRGSWGTALGGTPLNADKSLKPIIEDNTDAWCGDHCVATDLVPGVIFANKPIKLDGPDLEDVAPTILKAFGLGVPGQMTGHSVFEPHKTNANGKSN